MSGIGFILEKVRHGSELGTGEAKMLAEEIDRMMSKLEACARELTRREEADTAARQHDRARAQKLRQLEEEVQRLRESLAFTKQQRAREVDAHADKVRNLESLLRDVHYGLLHQPEHDRKTLADVIAKEVTPYPNIPWGPDHPAYDEMGQ